MKPEEMRRLLELAAKAAGMNDWQWREESQALAHYNTAMACFYRDYAGDAITWNPADDDGDSRRLEVTLGISVILRPGGIGATSYYPGRLVGIFWENFDEDVTTTDDRLSATRLVVLRAAAAIRDAMP